MNCKRAKTAIALWVGDDLDASSVNDLQSHLAECPVCRDRWLDMRRSLDVLHRVETPIDDRGQSGNIWPSVAARILRRNQARQPQDFNGWVPALAVSAACLAIAVIITDLAPRSTPMESAAAADNSIDMQIQAISQMEVFDSYDNIDSQFRGKEDPADMQPWRPRQPRGVQILDARW
jgi:hypothetical protein